MATKKYSVKGGGTIEAASDLELVEKLKSSSFTESPTQQKFMEDMAERCKTQTGHDIRTANPVVFITDLEGAGYLTLIESN